MDKIKTKKKEDEQKHKDNIKKLKSGNRPPEPETEEKKLERELASWHKKIVIK